MPLEEVNGMGAANDAVVQIQESGPVTDEEVAEQERVSAYLVHLDDARRAVEAAKVKVTKAQEHLDGAHGGVKEAEAHLARLEGRE